MRCTFIPLMFLLDWFTMETLIISGSPSATDVFSRQTSMSTRPRASKSGRLTVVAGGIHMADFSADPYFWIISTLKWIELLLRKSHWTKSCKFKYGLNWKKKKKTVCEVENFLGRYKRLQWNVGFRMARLWKLLVAGSSNWVRCLAANQNGKENKRRREGEQDFADKFKNKSEF